MKLNLNTVSSSNRIDGATLVLSLRRLIFFFTFILAMSVAYQEDLGFKEAGGFLHEINVSSFPKGMYIVKLNKTAEGQGYKTFAKKIVIE